jgi:hypothetical protein
MPLGHGPKLGIVLPLRTVLFILQPSESCATSALHAGLSDWRLPIANQSVAKEAHRLPLGDPDRMGPNQPNSKLHQYTSLSKSEYFIESWCIIGALGKCPVPD